jgi:hypothetical protein
MASLTEKSLGIFWNKSSHRKDDSYDYDEIDGLIAYGYWRNKPIKIPDFPSFKWPLIETSDFEMNGKNWFVKRWDIKIDKWPLKDKWEELLEFSLKHVVNNGALIAWFGIEGNFIEPPSLFDYNEMSPSGVYACYTKELGFKCSARLGENYSGFSNEDFQRLKGVISFEDL